MITTYDQVRSGIENRVSLKTLDSIFLKNIEHGAKCPPFVSQAILDSAKRIFNLGNRDREEQSIKPGQIKIVGILSSEPAGKPLKDCRTGICVVTLNAGKEDQCRLRLQTRCENQREHYGYCVNRPHPWKHPDGSPYQHTAKCQSEVDRQQSNRETVE